MSQVAGLLDVCILVRLAAAVGGELARRFQASSMCTALPDDDGRLLSGLIGLELSLIVGLTGEPVELFAPALDLFAGVVVGLRGAMPWISSNSRRALPSRSSPSSQILIKNLPWSSVIFLPSTSTAASCSADSSSVSLSDEVSSFLMMTSSFLTGSNRASAAAALSSAHFQQP
jgi:hypothetical protein